ncbi:unnamed protein product, partial [Amoebophrya sp. A120]
HNVRTKDSLRHDVHGDSTSPLLLWQEVGVGGPQPPPAGAPAWRGSGLGTSTLGESCASSAAPPITGGGVCDYAALVERQMKPDTFLYPGRSGGSSGSALSGFVTPRGRGTTSD